DQRPLVLVAEKGVRTLREVEQRYRKMQERLEVAQAENRNVKLDDDMDDLVVDALRFEASGNKAAALDKWKKVKDKYEKQYDQRLWYLLAIKKTHDMTGK